MKKFKIMMQVVLTVSFFALLATSTVFADDADSEGWQFVQENGRTSVSYTHLTLPTKRIV